MKTLIQITLFLAILLPQVTLAQGLHTKQAPLPCVDKTFTIVAHIVRDTFGEPNILETEISNAVVELNTAFEPICMQFEVCEFRYINNFQYDDLDRDEWEEVQVKYHVARRINMYFITSQTVDPLDLCGFAGLGQITNMESDGIGILKGECISRKTMAHEMGHYFGLLHTNTGSGVELVDGGNCETAGDLICDTPADPYVFGDPITSYISTEVPCRFISFKQDANSQFYSPHVGNYMSYYPDGCGCGFTYEQYLLMANTFLNSPDKMW